MRQAEMLYSGKAKTVYCTDDPEYLIRHFRNDASAFDGGKKAQLARKGQVNNRFNALHDPLINEYHIRTFGWADDAPWAP